MSGKSIRWLAWTLGALGAALCAFTFAFALVSGASDQVLPLFLACLFGLLMALLGGTIAARSRGTASAG